jgi:hypothetical protein
MRVALAVLGVAFVGLGGICFAQQTKCGNLIQGVKADKPAYSLGEKIAFQFALRNDSNQAITYKFSSSKQFDLWVTRGGEESYRLSRNRMYAQVITYVALKPGETKTYCAQWDQKDIKGKQVGPGAYTIYAQLTPTGNKPPTSTRVQVGARGATLIPITVKEAISNFTALAGKRVLISATYRGWSPDPNDPNTKDGPPVTRSDWAIRDVTGCMYVVGMVKLDPTKDKGAGITVVGKLEKTEKGQVYMILESATVEKKSSGTHTF